jgi:endothelin-converting enzyme/putative endopeptidase
MVACFSFTCASALDLGPPPERLRSVKSHAGTPLIAGLLKRLGPLMTGAMAAASLFLTACTVPAAPAPQHAGDFVQEMPPNVARLPRPRLGDDFYGYVNNQWLATYKLPADKASFGAAEELADHSESEVRTMIEEIITARPAKGTIEQKIADLYAAALDEKTIEARGLDPIRPHLARIHAATTLDDITRLMGRIGYNSPFSAGVAPSPVDPDANAVWISQAGLGMPHRGYYLDSGLQSTTLQVAYRRHISTILGLIGESDPDRGAQRLYNLEYRIAQAQTDEDRSISATESMRAMSYADLKAFAPGFDWTTFLKAAGMDSASRFVVTDQTAVPALAKLVSDVSIDDWKLWLEFHIASDFSPSLPKAFADSYFDFFTRQLSGITERPERWKFAISVVNEQLGDAVAELYVKRYFPADNKTKIDAIVGNIRTAFASRMRSLDWMDDKTRAAALAKLDALQGMIAYPDSWRDYSSLVIEPGKLVEGIFAAFELDWREQQNDLSTQVDRRRWEAPAHVVNAFYSPLGNTFVLPAGILQPPFFDPKADPAANYGGIGAVIGHEMSHGFDDQGRQFDSVGRAVNWWTSETDDRFVARSNQLIDQYDRYCPYFSACVNGLGTLGENIGDLAGLEIAYAAYHLSLGGVAAPLVDGLTGDQRFFLAYAQSYREKVREEYAKALLEGDSHAPSRYRVNGVIRNMDAWYAAFDIKPTDRLYLAPEERVRIW